MSSADVWPRSRWAVRASADAASLCLVRLGVPRDVRRLIVRRAFLVAMARSIINTDQDFDEGVAFLRSSGLVSQTPGRTTRELCEFFAREDGFEHACGFFLRSLKSHDVYRFF